MCTETGWVPGPASLGCYTAACKPPKTPEEGGGSWTCRTSTGPSRATFCLLTCQEGFQVQVLLLYPKSGGIPGTFCLLTCQAGFQVQVLSSYPKSGWIPCTFCLLTCQEGFQVQVISSCLLVRRNSRYSLLTLSQDGF